jgi:LacI family transcriptional regulator, repressor for deo operon, udp, cdd, tsx, nupC, and nupG
VALAAIGVVLRRRGVMPLSQPYLSELLAGIEDAVIPARLQLLTRMAGDAAEEDAIYRFWRRRRAVDGVILMDLEPGDRRPQRLNKLGLPYLVMCDEAQVDGFAADTVDNAQAMRDCLRFLAAKGHTRIGRVTGPPELVHTAIRDAAFEEFMARGNLAGELIAGDYSEAGGTRATADLLRRQVRPTAIVYDNDLMACGGLAAAAAVNLSVPKDLAVLAWDDSVRCQLARPQLTALSHDGREAGHRIASALLSVIRTGEPIVTPGPQPVLIPRASTD